MSDNIGMFAKTRVFFGEVRTELSKVVWPSQEQVKTYTLVVLSTCAILSILIGIWDLGLTQLVKLIFGL